jgi:hypothetical protein
MPNISKEEQIRRRNLMDSVLGTHAMEGMFPDEATLEIMRQYITGEFSMEDFSAAMDRHARSLLVDIPALVAVG